MKKLVLEDITIDLVKENNEVRGCLPTRSVILFEQNIENVSEIIQHNFEIVDSHYRSLIAGHSDISFDLNDIHIISLKIVM